MLKILAMIFSWELVWLQSYSGEIYLSRARENPFGGKWCYVYDYYQIGHVNLLPDGKCSGSSCYIEKWKSYK
jgi:hypothetical protein